MARERDASPVGDDGARRSDLRKKLAGEKPHHDVRLDADARRRLVTWLDKWLPAAG